MFEIGGLELLVIALVALIVLGPDRLPHAAVNAARVFNQLRRAWTGFQRRLFTEIALSEIDLSAPQNKKDTSASAAPESPSAAADSSPDATFSTRCNHSAHRERLAPHPDNSALRRERHPREDGKEDGQ